MKHQRIICVLIAVSLVHGLVILMIVDVRQAKSVRSKSTSFDVVLRTVHPPAEPQAEQPLPASESPPQRVRVSEPERVTVAQPEPTEPPPEQTQPTPPPAKWKTSPQQLVQSLSQEQLDTSLGLNPQASDAEVLISTFRPKFAEDLSLRNTTKARNQLLQRRHVAVHGLSPDAYNALGSVNEGRIKTRYGCGKLQPDVSRGQSGGSSHDRRWWWVSCNESRQSAWQLPKLETDQLGRAVVP